MERTVSQIRNELIYNISEKSGRWKILPRAVFQSMSFIGLSYAAKLVCLSMWNLLVFSRENMPLNQGLIAVPDAYLEALGVNPEDIDQAKEGVKRAGFFDHVKDDFWSLSERWCGQSQTTNRYPKDDIPF